MNVLIVHAHYEPQSFSTALMNGAISTLSEAGHSVWLSDLYAMQWNPVASVSDFHAPQNPDYCVYALEQRQADQTGSLADDVRTEIEKVMGCDLLILNFPMFWFSMPAILKGWIDRVFVSGRFYGGKRFYDRGGMRGKQALVTMTLGGREHMFGSGAIHGEMNVLLRPILQGTLAYAGFSVLPSFVAYHVPYVSDEDRRNILNEYRAYLARLETLEPLVFPSLSDFDDTMRPKTTP